MQGKSTKGSTDTFAWLTSIRFYPSKIEPPPPAPLQPHTPVLLGGFGGGGGGGGGVGFARVHLAAEKSNWAIHGCFAGQVSSTVYGAILRNRTTVRSARAIVYCG